jgi:hypothetical protein
MVNSLSTAAVTIASWLRLEASAFTVTVFLSRLRPAGRISDSGSSSWLMTPLWRNRWSEWGWRVLYPLD